MTTKHTERDSGIQHRKLVEVYRWNSRAVGSFKLNRNYRETRWEPQARASEGWGEFLGYAVSSCGTHNAVLQSEIRDSVEAAALDLANPDLTFKITGYICG